MTVTQEAALFLRLAVDTKRELSAADCWRLDAALHVEGRSADVGFRASENWPDARDEDRRDTTPDAPLVTDTAIAIGRTLARSVFAKRGNHAEAHLSEAELAALMALAVLRFAESAR